MESKISKNFVYSNYYQYSKEQLILKQKLKLKFLSKISIS